MTEEKQALIEYCEREIEKFKLCISEYPDAPVLRSDLKLHEIALAALTAQPIKLPEKYLCVGHMGEESLCFDPEEVISAILAAGYEVQE